MKIFLAPMEGLTDYYMRDMLTRIGGYDACVSEFIRVTDRLLPARTFLQYCPELCVGGRTAAGTPVHVQLLGSDPSVLADNAGLVASLGALHIDLNFGCPAKTVNRHRGGAVLLDEPETLYAIVRAVRSAVPAAIPVTAKMRLGVRDHSRMIENARAFEAAGASALVVHARTKEDGYRPPAHWEAIARICEAVALPVMANGEIWTVEDARRCQAVSGCSDLMLGRGAVTQPVLARRIRGEAVDFFWDDLRHWQADFLALLKLAGELGQPKRFGAPWTERGAIGRYKQWLAMLTRDWPEAVTLFHQVKKLQRFTDVEAVLSAAGPADVAA
ncbi:MAG: tRNA-dihydrouridine synthase [Moraxellaceae bacterium]|jgi:tRNA-dihydrouridine synthase C|nr:tRNA-dihydrouridine synthase [Moraxellaceae bacterium]